MKRDKLYIAKKLKYSEALLPRNYIYNLYLFTHISLTTTKMFGKINRSI